MIKYKFKYGEDNICKKCLKWIKDKNRGFHGRCTVKKMLTYLKYGRNCDDFRRKYD